MATRILVSCGDCGDIELGPEDLSVVRCVDTSVDTVVFRCSVCQRLGVKAAGERAVDRLLAAEVRLATWHLPTELAEPRPVLPKLAPPEIASLVKTLRAAPTPIDDAWVAWVEERFAPRP